MKVIAVNGSPREDGNTAAALRAMADVLKGEGIETEIVHVGGKLIPGCIGCGHCFSSEGNICVFKDDAVEENVMKIRAADGIILGAPTYYAGIPGPMKSFLDRVFFSSSRYLKYKVGTAVTAVRRAGGADVVHQLMNYFNLAETVTPPSQYWTIVYGMDKGEALKDEEGMQTVRKNARAMAWLLKVIDASKGKIPLPPTEKREFTNFIR
ncbi:FMN reductase [Synergistales bacterium]|nr:FMN reductase [Synergistales bacterium]GHV53953.1 FMN reductase [Synergistales bacterium]